MTALYARILERVTAAAGVRAASAMAITPMTQGGIDSVMTSTLPDGTVRAAPNVHLNFVGPRFFETLGIRQLAGRDFGLSDAQGAPGVCIVNRSAAQYFFPHTTALGQRLNVPNRDGINASYEIVGVVEDAKYSTLHQKPPRTVYRPYAQTASRQTRLTIALAGQDPSALADAYRAAIRAFASDAPLFEVVSLSAHMRSSVAAERAAAGLTAFLGGLSLFLMCISLFGHVAWDVTRRTAEIGTRMALGATRHSIVRLVVSSVLAAIGIGAILGVAGMVGLSRVLASLLYDTEPLDPILVFAAALTVMASGAAAAYFPARRAAGVDPLVALRSE